MALIARSVRRKLAVLVIAVGAFVLLYETQVFDSRSATWQSLLRDDAPAPGMQLPFHATAYCKGTTTASGVSARTGVAAADPQILPVGSVLNVSTGDSRYDGVYTVMDTGPKVQARTLDLYMWSCHEAQRFGRRQVQVTILRLGWDPRASSPSLVDRLFRSREARRVPPPAPPPPAALPPDDQPGAASGAGVDAPEASLDGPVEPPAPDTPSSLPRP